MSRKCEIEIISDNVGSVTIEVLGGRSALTCNDNTSKHGEPSSGYRETDTSSHFRVLPFGTAVEGSAAAGNMLAHKGMTQKPRPDILVHLRARVIRL